MIDGNSVYFHEPGQLSRGAVLDVGLKCSHSCRFCYYSFMDGSDKQFRGMRKAKFRTTEELKEILSLLKKKGFINFDVTGGEPTLHTGIIELMRYAHQDLGLNGRIITLGQFLVRKPKYLIKKLFDAGIVNFLFSLHAVDEKSFQRITGESFNRLRKAMDFLDEKSFQYCSNTTVFEWNYKSLPDIAREVLSHGIYLHNFILMNAYYHWNKGGKSFGVQAKYSQVLPYLSEAVSILESHDIAVNIRYAPMCAVKGLEKNLVGVVGVRYDPYEWMNRAGHFGGPPSVCADKYPIKQGEIEKAYAFIPQKLKMPNGIRVIGMRGKHFKYFSSKCHNCAAINVCDGVDPNYLANYGDNELIPYETDLGVGPVASPRLAYTPPFFVKTNQSSDMKSICKEAFNKWRQNLNKSHDHCFAKPSIELCHNRHPLISVIIPCYNQARYLGEAVTSIVGQSYENWEILIVNDGSTDNTHPVAVQIINHYPNKPIRLIDKKNGGVADSRNRGIETANGTWILPLDADDKFKPSFLEKAVSAIEEDSNLNLIFSNVRQFGAQNGAWVPNEYSELKIIEENCFPYASLFKKSIWLNIGGYSQVLGKVMQLEDWDFWIRASRMGINAHRIPEQLFLYRVHDSNIYYQVILPRMAVAKALTVTANANLYELRYIEHCWQIISNCDQDTEQRIRNTLSAYPKHALPYFWLGLKFEGSKSYESAVTYYRKAIEKGGENVWQAYHRLGMMQKHYLGFPSKAMDGPGNVLLSGEAQENIAKARRLYYSYNHSMRVKNTSRTLRILFYYEGFHNKNRPYAGTAKAIQQIATALITRTDFSVIIVGDHVQRTEKLADRLIIHPTPDSNSVDFIKRYDIVFFATHTGCFATVPKPAEQRWILLQHCWDFDIQAWKRIDDFDKIICVSRPQKERFTRIRRIAQKIAIIPNGVDTNHFKESVIKGRKLHSIMFAGAIVPHKNVHILIEAFRLLKQDVTDAELHIYGSASMWSGAPEDYQERLQKVKANGVFFHGAIPNEEMPDNYARHSILVLPSSLESFGLVTIEAQACGCIPVVYRTGGTEDTLLDGKTGFFYTDNTPKSLKATIKKAFRAIETDPEMRQAARKFVLSNFGLDLTSNKLLHLIKNLGIQNNKTLTCIAVPGTTDENQVIRSQSAPIDCSKGMQRIAKNTSYAACLSKAAEEFEVKDTVRNTVSALVCKREAVLPVHFFTIVLNGQPFIRHHIDVFKKLPFQWYWHIVEGVAALKNDTAWSLQFGGRIENKFHRNGLSNDGTTEYLDSLAQENPGQIHIYRKPKGVFWDGKLEMVNAPLKNITEPCLLWQIDADELWTVEQVTTARQMFIDNPGKTAAYYFCHYFVGPDLITTTRDTYGNHSEYEWLRTWRYLPGDHWESHEPPRLRRPSVSGPMKDIAALHPFSHAETEKQGLVFQHFAYATEAQVRFKENYFGYKGAVQGWKRLQRQERFPVFLRNFFPWVTDETKVDRASALNLIPIAKKDPSGKWEFNLPTQQISKTRILASSIPKKILWIRTDSIGDTILSASMLPEIVKNYKAVSIFVVCQEHASEIYAACPFVDKVIGFDRKRMYSDESYQREILQRLNTLSIDLAVNSVFSSEPLTHFLTLKSGARKTIGIQGDLCNIDLENQSQFLKNYTQVCTIDSASHSAELGRHRAFLASFGIDASSLAPVIWTTSEDEHFADDFFRKNELVPEKTIALFAGAQSGIRYYFQYGRALSMALENDPDYCVLALGSDHEKTINQKNLDATGLRTFNLCGQTTIRQAAAIIKRCRLAVGAETGLAHATCAVGTPNVVLLGGGHFGRFMPYSPLTTVACLPLSCYGCNWQCRYERPYCIKDLSPHVLAEAVKAAFASASNKMRIVTQDRSSWKPAADMPEWRLPDIANDAKRFEIMSTFASAGKSLSDVLNDEGEALFARGKAENARSTFEKASAADPQDARAHNNLGVVYHRLGREEQALAHYQKAVTLAPNAKTYQKNLADFYCVALGEIEKAMQLYVSVLRKDPRDAEALRAMGRICQALGRSTDAQSFFQRAQHADLQDEKASENPAQLSLPPQSRRSEFSIEATANGPESDYHHQYLVSAIVSTYNAERFIRGCMEDLERQTIADRLEIIVVDSGSQENEAQIVREFQQRFQNIKYIRTEQRESVYAAWNRGIKAASGKYITNANTDDRHRGDAFEVMSSILETLPEISLVYADVIITKTANESFKHCTPVGFYRWMNFNRDDLLNKGCYVGPQPMWRRQVHDEYGYFDETFVTSGDYEFWLRISQTGTFLHIPVLLGLYLKSPHSIEHANRDRQAEENRRIFKMYADAKSSGEVLGRINPPDKLPVDGSAGPKPAENVYKDVQGLIRKGEYDPAVEKLKLMTAEFPYFAPPYNDLGILYHSRGDLETALSSYQKAVELAPENATFQKNLADFYCVALGKIEAAMEIYVRVLQRDPLDIEALLAMGYICRRFERFEDAKSFYARVLEIDADNETARRFMGLAEPSRAETDDTPLSAETAYEQLLEDMQHDPLDAGIAKISAFLAAFPDLAHAHSDIGALYQRAGASDKAEKHLQKAALLAKDNPQFQKNLADFYLVERDRKEPALEIYRRLLDKDPGNKQLLLLAGHVCVALKRLSDAAVFYRRLLAEDPGNTDARTNLEAIEGIEEAHDKKSPPPGKTPRGKVLQEPGDGSTAQLDAAPAEGPDDPQVSILISALGPVNRLRSRVQAIERHTDTPYELIFLDSGVTKGTDQWLQQFLDQNDHGHRIRCGHATNAATAVNAGIAASHSKMILRLSNDVEVTPGWLASMITHLERNADTGIVGAMSNVAAERQKAPLPWSKGEDTLAKFAAAYRQRNRHRRIPANTIDGFCMLFTRQLFENIGPFDEELGQGGYDGEDFCLRATLAGCQNLIAGDVYLHRHLKKKPPRDKKAFTLKWSGADVKTPAGKKYLALLTERKARRAWQAERVDEAGELFLQAIGLQPESCKSYHRLAEMLIQTKQYENALEVLNELPEGEPDVREIVLKACCQEGLGRLEEAQQLVDRALEINPLFAPALNRKGLLAYQHSDRHNAGGWFQRALAADPGFGEAYTNLGALKWEAGEKDAALELYERAFILEPAIADIAANYHAAMSDLNQYARGVPILREAVSAYPFSKKIRYMLIDCLIRLQQYAAAMETIESAIADFGIEDGILASALKVREILGPLEIESHDPNHPTVSLCMITKNEQEHLARCLRSAKPVVDEIIVTDTGSNDRSIDIARAFGAKVNAFAWTEDFSAARNDALSQATGGVIFVMDADEVISPTDYPEFRRIARQSGTKRCAYIVNTRNYTMDNNLVSWVANDGCYGAAEAGTGWTPSAKIRIFPNDRGVRFDFPVHEMVEPSLEKAGIPMLACDIQIHHYGKLNSQKSRTKGEAYYEIGRKKLAETKDAPVALRELATQAEILGKHDESIELWKRFIALLPNEPKAYINMGITYCSLGQFDNVLATAEKVLQLRPESKEGHYNYALAKLHLGCPEQARETLKELCHRMPEYLPARFLMAATHCVMGKKDTGMAMLAELSRTSIGPGLAIRCHELAKAFAANNRFDYARSLLDAAIDSKNSNKNILNLYADCLEHIDSDKKTGTYE